MSAYSEQTFSFASGTYMRLHARLRIRRVQFIYELLINVQVVTPAFRSSAELFKWGKADISLFSFSRAPHLNSKEGMPKKGVPNYKAFYFYQQIPTQKVIQVYQYTNSASCNL